MTSECRSARGPDCQYALVGFGESGGSRCHAKPVDHVTVHRPAVEARAQLKHLFDRMRQSLGILERHEPAVLRRDDIFRPAAARCHYGRTGRDCLGSHRGKGLAPAWHHE